MNKFNKCRQSLNPGDLTSSDELSKCTRVHHLIFLNPPWANLHAKLMEEIHRMNETYVIQWQYAVAKWLNVE